MGGLGSALVAVPLNAALFLWVAIASGYPIHFYDTFGYLNCAIEHWVFLQSAARRLLDAATVLQWSSGCRSKGYDTYLVLTGAVHSSWLPVVANAFVSSWMVWAAVRCLLPRPSLGWTIGIGLALAALTSLPWVASFLMPDAFTAPLVLGTALLAVGGARLSLGMALALALIVVVAVAVHPSHIALGCVLVAALALLKLPLSPWRAVVRPWLAVGAILAGWAGTILAGFLLLGVVSPVGMREPPPFVLARFIADGTVRRYLAENCSRENWALCPYQDLLNDDENDFLWNRARPWRHRQDGPGLMRRIRAEQTALLAATFRAHGPRMVADFLRNGLAQLATDNPDIASYASDEAKSLLHGHDALLMVRSPDIYDKVFASWQGRADADFMLAARLLRSVEIAALLAIALACGVPALRRRASEATGERFWPLVALLAVGMIANAWITGGLSGVFGRYQARVVWLLPFAAMLVAGALASEGRRARSRPVQAGNRHEMQ